MKKAISILLASALMLGVFAGCKKEENQGGDTSEPGSTTSTPGTTYKDGEYSASYSVMAIDRTLDYLTVRYSGDKAEIVTYGGKEDTTAPPDSPAVSSESASADAATEAEERARKNMVKIMEAYDAAGQDLDKMIPVEGAEEHFYRFIRMMREITEAAKKGDTTAISLKRYADGTYKVTMPEADENGWTAYIEVAVADGEISKITYDALKDGKKITEDAEANSVESGKPSEYYPAIVQAYNDAGGDLTKLFAPTGGAAATKTFVKLMTPAVAAMTSGGEKELTAPRYVNGTYRAEMTDFDEYGWKEYVVVQIANGNVIVKEFDAMSKDDEKKLRSEDAELDAKMKEATGAYSFSEAGDRLARLVEKANGDVLQVENVAGATITSNNFKLLVGTLLATNAAEGDTETVVKVERVAAEKAS